MSSWQTTLAGIPPRVRLIIAAACAIALIGLGVRASFGLFLEPMTLARAWPRETFALAMAWQNLAWGIGTPLAGVLADRYGAPRVMLAGALRDPALEPRVAAVVQLCMLADIAPLIAAGVHDRHGAYLTVPGLLPRAEIGDVAGLIAPHPQFVGHGGQDPLTPPAARDAALMRLIRRLFGRGEP